MNIADINGTWEVNITATGGTQSLPGTRSMAYIKAIQTGTKVSGVFTTPHGFSGQVAGNVLGDEVTVRIDQGPDCPGIFHGVAKVHASNKKMTGTYSGVDSTGTLEASFIATKMKFYAVALNKLKLTIFSSEKEKLLFFRLILPVTTIGLAVILAIILSVRYIELIIPHFRALLYLSIILIFGLYGLYQAFKGN